MSTMETPPPETPVHAGPPERRCPRCGSNLAVDQEWCLNCGAAAGTEVVEARGWRVPLYLGGGLIALAVIGVILAIVALSSRNDVVAGNPTPTPSAQAPPGATPTTPPLATGTPLPSTTPDPLATPTVSPDASASPTTTPEATETATPEATATATATAEPTTTGTFPGWTGQDGDYTIIIESADSQSEAEKVAQKAQDKGLSDVGILDSSSYSSLNGGYQVVFTGVYTSKSDAQSALSSVSSDFKDAYVRQIKS